MDIKDVWKAASQQAEMQVVGIDDDQELQPRAIVDDRIYAMFIVQPLSQRSQYFTRELVAKHQNGDELPLPWTIKNLYRSTEAAQDVRQLCEQLFVGKSVTTCNQMLGVSTHE